MHGERTRKAHRTTWLLQAQVELLFERKSVPNRHQPAETVVAWVVHREEERLRLLSRALPSHQKAPLRGQSSVGPRPSALARQPHLNGRIRGDGMDDAQDTYGERACVWLVLEREVCGACTKGQISPRLESM
jgi:hypothetical protein